MSGTGRLGGALSWNAYRALLLRPVSDAGVCPNACDTKLAIHTRAATIRGQCAAPHKALSGYTAQILLG